MNFKKFLMLLALPLAFVLGGCESGVPDTGGILPECAIENLEGTAIDKIEFSAQGGETSFIVKANRSWNAAVTADWFAVTPSSKPNANHQTIETEVKVTAFANTEASARQSVIAITVEGFPTPIEVTVNQLAEGQVATGEVIYYDNFDKIEAVKDGSYWPYMSAEYGNPTPEDQTGVTYESKNVTARANSNSDGTHSDYAGSGKNNMFFGKENHLTIKGISLAKLDGNALTITFGTEKYSQDNGSVFTPSEFHLYISGDNGEKWSEVSYTFAGTAEGRWNVATAQFNLKEVPATLAVKFVADVASSYRMDDLTILEGGGGAEIDLSQGTANGNGGGNTGGDDNGGNDEPVVAEGPYASDAAFVCSTDDSTNAAYGLGETTLGGNAATGFKLGKSKQEGKFTSRAIGVSGDKYLNFYAVAWGAGGDKTIYFRVNGGEVKSQAIKANEGAANNAPYNSIVLAETDHYSILLSGLNDTDKIEFSTNAAFDCATTTDYATRAIFFGVKLTDEALGAVIGGGNTGGDDNGGNTGGDDNGGNTGDNTSEQPTNLIEATIAEFLAASVDNTTWYKLTGTITDIAKESYGNFYIKDETGDVYIYGMTNGWVGSNNQSFSSIGLKVGDIVTLGTLRGVYNDVAQGGGNTVPAFYISHVAGEAPDGPDVPEGSTLAEFTAKGLGIANSTSVDGKTISLDDNISIVFGKGSASNAPAYYDDGEAIRMYQNGATLNVTAANGKTISSIEISFSKNMYYVVADSGTISAEANIRTWTGDASAVKFTCNGTDKNHRAYVKAIKVIYK